MPASISEFRAKFKSDPASPAYFEVFVLPPQQLVAKYAKLVGSGLRYQMSSTEIPGRIIQTVDHKLVGPIQKIAVGSLYNSVNVEIQVNGAWKEREVFEAWHNLITNNVEFGGGGLPNHLVKYYNDYIGTVLIIAYNKQNAPTYEVTLEAAIPTTIAAINMNWESSSQVAKFSVTFDYKYHTTKIIGP